MPSISRGDIGIDLGIALAADLSLLRMSSLLYDLTLLHEYSVLIVDPEYGRYRFDQFFWRRNGRPLAEEQRLIVRSLTYGSPAKLSAAVKTTALAISGVFVLVQGIALISTIDLNRSKMRAEIALVEAQTAKTRLESEELRRRLWPSGLGELDISELAARHGRPAQETLHQLMARLSAQQVAIDALHISTVGSKQK